MTSYILRSRFALFAALLFLLSTQVRNYGDVFVSSGRSQPPVLNLFQKGVKIAAGESPLEG